MKKADVKIGMKVVPFKKRPKTDDLGIGKKLSDSVIWRRAIRDSQPFLFVVAEERGMFGLGLVNYTEWGYDFFDASDFNLYKEE